MNNKAHKDAAIEKFTLAISLLLRRIRADAPPELREFSWTQKAVLSRLERDGPATAAELARAEGVKPQSMGTVIATLEERGLIERKPHPTDGRQMIIKLSAKGNMLRRDTREAKHAWLDSAFTKLSSQEQAILVKAGELIERMVKEDK